MKKGVINKIFLCLTFLFLIGVVSAWSVDITKLNNNAPTNYYNAKVTKFSYQLTGINCDNVTGVWYTLNNGVTNSSAGCSSSEITLPGLNSNEGANDWKIYASDDATTTNSDSLSFWVDSIYPILNYVIPSTNLVYTNLDILSFQFFLDESNKGFYWGLPDKYFSFNILNKYGVNFYSNVLGIDVNNNSEQDSVTLVGGNKYEGDYTYIAYAKDIYPDGNVIREINKTGVIIRDITAPVLTLNGADPITLEALSDSYIEFGATATDNLDPLINSNIIIDSSAVDTTTLGTYTVTYDVQDQAGNPATQITRTVNVVDTTAPIITLVGSDPINIEVFTPYVDSGATALDNYDGDITGNIVTANPVNTNPLGTYIVTYDVMDSSGNPATQITRTVNVVDTIVPTISIFIPTNNTFTKDSSQDVNFTVADITLNTCWYSNDTYTANTTLANCNTNITTIAWSEGQHNVTIWVNDSANNVNSSQVTFTIDTTLPAITNFQVLPNVSISQFNPMDVSADISDINLDYVDIMLLDSNNLMTPSDQLLFYININESGFNGNYNLNWPANYFKITDGITSEPVGVIDADTFPGEYIVLGYFQENPAASVEECMLLFDDASYDLTLTTCSVPIIPGTSKFTVASMKFTNGMGFPPVEVNGSEFTLYDLSNPALNPKLESALAPTGDYTVILRTEDLAENENAEILNISVDNTAPTLTDYLIEVQGLIPTTNNIVYISPQNSLNLQDGLNLNITANEIVDWTIRIQKSDGSLATSSQWTDADEINIIKPSNCFWNGTATQCSGGANLIEGTYTINVTLIDKAGNSFADLSKQIIIDNTLPILSNIQSTNIGTSSATITWTTNENANSSVYYGTTILTTSNLNSATFETAHSISLSSLSASTLYYFNVSSCDAGGNCNTSIQYSFTTSAISDGGTGSGGGSSGGSGGGSSATYYACSKWSDWSACKDAKQTRTCLEKITTTFLKGVIESKFNATETQTCTASALTPLSNTNTETEKTNIAPVELTEKTQTFVGRITGGITGAATGFTKSKGGKVSLIVVGILALM